MQSDTYILSPSRAAVLSRIANENKIVEVSLTFHFAFR